MSAMDITQKLSKFAVEVRRGGARAALAKATHHVAFLVSNRRRRVEPSHVEPSYARRLELFADLSARLCWTVGYGPFKGMKLPADTSWGGPDRATMLLGMYEQEVMNALSEHSCGSGTFINLGAANGFYGVGVLLAGWFKRAYCYEMSEAGQVVIRQNARDNGVSDDLVVRGIATPRFYREISPNELDGAVILIDIEGGEFEILDAEALEALRSTTIIVEIHQWVEDGDAKFQQLKEFAERTHKLSSFGTGPRDPNQFEELRAYCDTDRWLMCSEDRPILMTWLLLEPR